ncbi:MAG: MarR family winged helix-turn-helix transcriptional regulator [Acidimicrobiales bacterium]
MPAPRPDAAGEIADLVQHVGHRLRHRFREQLEPLGITWAQFRVLRRLVDAGEPMRMSDLAARLDIVPRSATSLVDDLEAAGFVARSAHPTDRRVTLVAPTRRGRKVIESASARRRSAIAPMVDRLDPTEQAELAALLRRLVESS